MKNFKVYIAYLAIFAMIFTSCSKDENSVVDLDESNSEAVELTFGAVLNDLANRSMNKAHFDDVPTCSDADPAFAIIGISVDGVVKPDVTVAILSDSNGYFTAYSEALKILIPSGESVTITLNSFIVYDGDPSLPGSEIIWIAPIENEAGEFDGYVDNPLPFDFELEAGSKPYIDVEVLCFDRRMVNEYGYVFFDISDKELIELCLFGNFCTPEGRHYVANYSVDVWLRNSDGSLGTQLYDDVTRISTLVNGEYAASPLCLVLPDDTDLDESYYVEISILDGPNYNTTPRLVKTLTITDAGVRAFFNDEVTSEYAHFFVGCDIDDIFDEPGDASDQYTACLRGFNGSNSIAITSMKLQGNELSVIILAAGMEANKVHPQHIHGFADDSNATCPTMAADTDSNGLVSLTEGLPFYGPVQLSLEVSPGVFPTASVDGSYFYSRTFTLTSAQLAAITPLDKKAVVLHGRTVNGTYEITLPVSCGELEESGVIVP